MSEHKPHTVSPEWLYEQVGDEDLVVVDATTHLTMPPDGSVHIEPGLATYSKPTSRVRCTRTCSRTSRSTWLRCRSPQRPPNASRQPRVRWGSDRGVGSWCTTSRPESGRRAVVAVEIRRFRRRRCPRRWTARLAGGRVPGVG